MTRLNKTLKTKDGLTLQLHQWLANNLTDESINTPLDSQFGLPKGVIFLVHGLGEHAGRYQHVAEVFNKAGYSLVSYDLRGHGLSEGKRGHTPDFECLHDDIQTVVDTYLVDLRDEKGDVTIPLYIYGHSLGGLQVITYLLRRTPTLFKAAIVTSPALRPAFSPPAWKLWLAKAIVKLVPSLSLSNEIDVTHVSRDKNVIDSYLVDKRVHDRISASLGLSILEQGEWALENADKLTCPMLLLHGSADKVTSCEASQTFAENAGDLCHFEALDGLFHETHNEPEKAKVLSKIISWLNQL